MENNSLPTNTLTNSQAQNSFPQSSANIVPQIIPSTPDIAISPLTNIASPAKGKKRSFIYMFTGIYFFIGLLYFISFNPSAECGTIKLLDTATSCSSNLLLNKLIISLLWPLAGM